MPAPIWGRRPGLLDRSYTTLVSVLRRAGKREQAEAAERRAREHRAQLPPSDPASDPPPRRAPIRR